MLAKIAVIISPNWGDYASKYLADCLASLRAQDYEGGFKLFLIDNASTAESLALLENLAGNQFADLEIIANKNNDGFAKGNNEAMRLALAQNFDYLVLINMDTVVDPSCLSALVKVAEADDKIGAVQARLMLWPDKELINSLGNKTHFLGFGYSEGYREKFTIAEDKNICYPSGAAVLFKAEILKQIDLFDEEFWMYNEDQDLGWRLWLAGWRCVLAGSAVVYHKYEFVKAIKQYYWLDRNRDVAILKNYRLGTLLLIAPAWLIMEIGLFLFAIKGGWLKEKLKVYGYFLKPSTWRYLAKARRAAQSLRQTSDRQIVKMFSGKILYQEIDSPVLRLANFWFNIYWSIVRSLIFW